MAPWAITEARYGSVGPSGRLGTVTSVELWQRRYRTAPPDCPEQHPRITRTLFLISVLVNSASEIGPLGGPRLPGDLGYPIYPTGSLYPFSISPVFQGVVAARATTRRVLCLGRRVAYLQLEMVIRSL